MKNMTLGNIADACGGIYHGTEAAKEKTIAEITTDSRKAGKDSLFVAIKGERVDAHKFIPAVFEQGALCVISEQELEAPAGAYIQVDSSLQAIKDIAEFYRKQLDIKVVGITGSVGKTSTKEMIASVLSEKYRVLKTLGNFNNELGLPLTVFRLREEDEIAVLEMGMDRFGEIDYLAGTVKPDVGVITNIGDAHIERLGSRENIFKAKCELLPHIKGDGLLVLNGDDPMLSTLRGNTPVETVFCGRDEGLEYRAQVTGGDGVSHIHCRLTTPHMDRDVKIPALGEHMIYPALIAAAVGEWFGLTPDQIEQGLTRFVPTRMRMNILRRGGGITILDDTYNANPQSMRAAVSVLADSHSAWKAAVLGDMLELGPFAPALHSGVGEYLGKAGINCLVAVGEMSEHMAQGARDAGVPMVCHCCLLYTSPSPRDS